MMAKYKLNCQTVCIFQDNSKQKTSNPWGLYATYASDATQSVGLALMTSTNHQQMLRLIQFSPIISFYDTNAAKSLIALWQTEHQY